MAESFENAKFFSCFEVEQLTFDNPEEAIHQWLDECWTTALNDDASVSQWESALREECPVTVTAYDPKTVSEERRTSWAIGAAESLTDDFWENYCDPEDDGPRISQAVAAKFREAVDFALSEWPVWQCRQVATREFSYEEVLKVAREYFPELFTQKEADHG